MSEEKRIDRLEDISIDTRVRIATLEATTDRIEKSTEKIASDISSLKSEFSNLRNEFFKLDERLTWRIITFSSLGGAVAGILMIFFGTGGN